MTRHVVVVAHMRPQSCWTRAVACRDMRRRRQDGTFRSRSRPLSRLHLLGFPYWINLYVPAQQCSIYVGYMPTTPWGDATVTAVRGKYGIRTCLKTSPVSYKRHRFQPQIIAHSVWVYFRFSAEPGSCRGNASGARYTGFRSPGSPQRFFSTPKKSLRSTPFTTLRIPNSHASPSGGRGVERCGRSCGLKSIRKAECLPRIQAQVQVTSRDS